MKKDPYIKKLELFLDDLKKEHEFTLAFEEAIKDSIIFGTSKISMKEEEDKMKAEIIE